MNKRFAINYNAEAADGGGGSTEVSATMTAPAQSEVAGSSESMVSYDAKYFTDLGDRVERGEHEPTEAELQAYQDFQAGLDPKRVADKPAPTDARKEEVSKTTDSKDPNGSIDVDKLVKEGKSNTWTAEESAAVEAAMARTGAKSPRELLEKVEGVLSLAGKKGGEAGELQKANQELQEKMASLDALHRDLAAGKPEAIRYLQETYGLSLAQAKAEAVKAGGESSEFSMPEGIIDTELSGVVSQLKKTYDGQLTAMQKQIAEFQQAEKTRQEQAQASIEQERKATEIRNMRNKYVDELVSIAEQDPETYGVKSAPVRDLLNQYYATGKLDPRLANHMELMKFALEKGLPSLSDAFQLKRASNISKLLIEAEERGRKSVLEVGKPQSLSGLRSGSNGAQNPQNYTDQDIAAMAAGTLESPKEWYSNGMLMRNLVPEGYRKQIFGY